MSDSFLTEQQRLLLETIASLQVGGRPIQNPPHRILRRWSDEHPEWTDGQVVAAVKRLPCGDPQQYRPDTVPDYAIEAELLPADCLAAGPVLEPDLVRLASLGLLERTRCPEPLSVDYVRPDGVSIEAIPSEELPGFVELWIRQPGAALREVTIRRRLWRFAYAMTPAGFAAIAPATEANEQPSGAMSPRDLASLYGLDPESTRKALETWRKMHAVGDGFFENRDRRPNEPQFLYRLEAVAPVLERLKGLQTRREIRRKKSSSRPRPKKN